MKICPSCKKSFDDQLTFCPQDGNNLLLDGKTLLPEDRLFVGSILDNQYKIEAMVGEGGMGTVYRARHTLLGDQVAIKILIPEVCKNPDIRKRFLREGQA